MKLDQRGKVLAEYIWIDGSNGLRNKTKVSAYFRFSWSRFSITANPALDKAPTLNIAFNGYPKSRSPDKQPAYYSMVDPTLGNLGQCSVALGAWLNS
jgi:hypothetical protein